MNKILIFLVVSIFIVSCQGTQHCVKLGGSSDRYGIEDGSFEYCYSKEKSDVEKANVLVSNTGDEYFIVNKKYIERANLIIESQTGKERIIESATEKERAAIKEINKKTTLFDKFTEFTK